jgi:hypothetical protein
VLTLLVERTAEEGATADDLHGFFQTPPDLLVKFQTIDIVGFIL